MKDNFTSTAEENIMENTTSSFPLTYFKFKMSTLHIVLLLLMIDWSLWAHHDLLSWYNPPFLHTNDTKWVLSCISLGGACQQKQGILNTDFRKSFYFRAFVVFVLMYYSPIETKNEYVFSNINLCLSLLGCVIMSWSHVL